MRCFVVVCRECEKVLGQCGCDRPKIVDYITCDDCRDEKEINHGGQQTSEQVQARRAGRQVQGAAVVREERATSAQEEQDRRDVEEEESCLS